MHRDHEPKTRKWLEINVGIFRFMESRLSPLRMHRDHEPDRSPDVRNVAQFDRWKYDASDLGLLVGEIGSGQRHVYRLVSLCFPLERLVLLGPGRARRCGHLTVKSV